MARWIVPAAHSPQPGSDLCSAPAATTYGGVLAEQSERRLKEAQLRSPPPPFALRQRVRKSAGEAPLCAGPCSGRGATSPLRKMDRKERSRGTDGDGRTHGANAARRPADVSTLEGEDDEEETGASHRSPRGTAAAVVASTEVSVSEVNCEVHKNEM
ncbi:hypothetical protein MHYP_G00212540 [Metynnis hypsauchen]